MNDVLLVMNPRQIPECMEPLSDLPIQRIHLQGFTEAALASEGFPQALEYDFDWYWVMSDDIIVRPQALEAVRTVRDLGHPVVTGYSQRSHTDWRVNLTRQPLMAGSPGIAAYDFRTFAEIVSWPDRSVPTWFAGFSLTGMSREMWLRFPFETFGDPGWASDFSLSQRLGLAGVPIMAAREGFAYHWRHNDLYGEDPRDEQTDFTKGKAVVLV